MIIQWVLGTWLKWIDSRESIMKRCPLNFLCFGCIVIWTNCATIPWDWHYFWSIIFNNNKEEKGKCKDNHIPTCMLDYKTNIRPHPQHHTHSIWKWLKISVKAMSMLANSILLRNNIRHLKVCPYFWVVYAKRAMSTSFVICITMSLTLFWGVC